MSETTSTAANLSRTRALIVMGVTGCGKSTVGEGLSRALGWPFIEGDVLHPDANVAKMASGVPLTDDDRWPWLDTVGGAMRKVLGAGNPGPSHGVVASCSSLKRTYRERLAAAIGEPPLFVFLDGTQALIGARLAARQHHFMPASLLESQFATLERPAADEPVAVMDVSCAPEETIRAVVALLGR